MKNPIILTPLFLLIFLLHPQQNSAYPLRSLSDPSDIQFLPNGCPINCLECSRAICLQCDFGFQITSIGTCEDFNINSINSKNRLLTTEKDTSIILKDVINIGTNVIFILASILTLIEYSNPAPFISLALIKMFYYLKYYDYNYPALLNDLLTEIEPDYSYTMFSHVGRDHLLTKAPTFQRLYIFENYQFFTSFLMNFWSPLVTLTLALVITIIVCALVPILKRTRFALIPKALKQTFKWNFLASLLFIYYDGIILYSSFELKSTNLNSTASIISFAFSILLLAVLLVTLLRSVHVIYQIKKTLIYQNPQDLYQKWSSYRFLYESINHSSALKQLFYPIYIIRICIPYLLLAYLTSYPLIQAIALLSINVIMLLYLIFISPSKNKAQKFFFIGLETTLLIANICVLLLAAGFTETGKDETIRKVCGYVIVSLYTLIVVASGIIMAARILYRIYSLYKNPNKTSQVQPIEDQSKMTKINATKSLDTFSISNINNPPIPSADLSNIQGDNFTINYGPNSTTDVPSLYTTRTELRTTEGPESKRRMINRAHRPGDDSGILSSVRAREDMVRQARERAYERIREFSVKSKILGKNYISRGGSDIRYF